jgi:hypothetical protein
LCLHDELLVHTPSGDGTRRSPVIVDDALQETAARWQQPELGVPMCDSSPTRAWSHCWSDAK